MKRKKSVMTKIVEEFELYGKQYRLETGELAKQATGAVLVTCGATEARARDRRRLQPGEGLRLLPAHGRLHREDVRRGPHPRRLPEARGEAVRPRHARGPAWWTAPIRPGFPDGYKNEVHIVATPFVIDGENLPDTICVAGASAALLVGGAPFRQGPAACVRIGRDHRDRRVHRDPTVSDQENSDLELTIAGAPPTTSPWSRPALPRSPRRTCWPP